MAITPQTDIRLLKVPFELDNKNQLTFASLTAQTTYFTSLNYLQADNCTYQRKDNVIRFPAHIDSIIEYNYVMYQNENYSNKWFYAFITNMQYINDNMTEISIKTDTWQTWQFDLIYKNSFVEREHVNDDTIGLHTIPENLDIGEVICIQEDKDETLNTELYYVAILSSWNIDSGDLIQNIGATVYGKQVFPKDLYLIDFSISATTGISNLAKFLYKTDVDGHIEDIGDVFIIPKGAIDNSSIEAHSVYIHQLEDAGVTNPYVAYYKVNAFTTTQSYNLNIDKITSFTGLTIKNNKCFCYPYNYLYATNNVGNSNIYKYEMFSGNKATFNVGFAISVGGSGICTPTNYKGQTKAIDESIQLGKYPVCAWGTDAYTNWLTQNAVNIPTKILGGLAGVGIGVAATMISGGNVALGAAVAGIALSTQIGQTIGEFREANLLPNIEGGQNTGDINFGLTQNGFSFKHMRAKNEYLKIIDDYFSAYGYKVNQVKIPNITGRTNWNYVKTINANILGDIPQEDIEEIKNMFNSGITLWHNSSTFLDYSQTNSIVS